MSDGNHDSPEEIPGLSVHVGRPFTFTEAQESRIYSLICQMQSTMSSRLPGWRGRIVEQHIDISAVIRTALNLSHSS